MQVFEQTVQLQEHLNVLISKRRSIGFVPTMGALHEGHLSLIKESKKENDITVCSIFVNPTQFNNPDDLKNYPRVLDIDLDLLKQENCDLVFHPSVDEVFPVLPDNQFDFGTLEKVMEGEFRPGHFNGVATVVKRLFEIIHPTRAYFGVKDYQQLVIIHKMTSDLNISTEIIPCEIVREKNGLAMSSRNQLLSSEEKKQAELIFQTLKFVKIRSGFTPIGEIKRHVEKQFQKARNVRLEYFDIVDMYSLNSLNSWAESNHVIACIAAYVGNVRLIDNIILFS